MHQTTPKNPANRQKFLLDLIGGMLIALLIVVGYKLSPQLLPTADLNLLPDPQCDLQHANCRVDIPGGGSIELDMGRQPIPLVRAFAVQVTTHDLATDRVEVDFTALDMNMGRNRITLADQGGGRHLGQATLPVCITGSMRWQATILVARGRQRLAIPYRFDANASL